MNPIVVDAEPAAWPPHPGASPSNTALFIIDMQRDFCDPGGYISALGYDISAARALVPKIAAVRRAFAAWGGLVIHTREGHRADLSDLSRQKAARALRGGAEIGSAGPLGRLLVRGEAGWDIIPELAPELGELVIDKPGYSAFHATDLQQILMVRGIVNLVLTGVTTDICVHSTLRSAIDRGFDCLLLDDCCAATIESNHCAAVETVKTEGGIFGSVSSSERVLESFGTINGSTSPQKSTQMMDSAFASA